MKPCLWAGPLPQSASHWEITNLSWLLLALGKSAASMQSQLLQDKLPKVSKLLWPLGPSFRCSHLVHVDTATFSLDLNVFFQILKANRLQKDFVCLLASFLSSIFVLAVTHQGKQLIDFVTLFPGLQ